MNLWHKLFPCPTGRCKDRILGCHCGVIGTTAAIIGAVAAGGIGAYAASSSSKAANKEAQSQQDWQTAQYAPAKELEQLQLQQYKDITMPYTQDIYGLWKDYGKGVATQQLQGYQALGTKIAADVQDPWQDLGPIYDKIWQQTREKTAAEWSPIEQRTSQRLAGAGALDSGASLKMFGDIEQAKYKSNETMAIDQAIQEFNLQAQAKQQSYTNAMAYMNYNPTAPSASTSNVGTIQPYTPIPQVSSGLAEGLSTGARVFSLLYGGGGASTTAGGTSNIANNSFATQGLPSLGGYTY